MNLEAVAGWPDFAGLPGLPRLAGLPGRIEDVRLLGSGFEADVYACRLRDSAGSRALAVRLSADAAGPRTMRRAYAEFAVMQGLRALGFPVPEVLAAGELPAPVGPEPPAPAGRGRAYLVMERIDGRSLGERYWSDDPALQADAREMLFDLMTRLHGLDVGALTGLAEIPPGPPPADPVEAEIALLDRDLSTLGPDCPGSLRAIVTRLRDRAARANRVEPALVHGDFHYNNVLVRADGAAYVIDWSNARIADPRTDLAWLRAITGGDSDIAGYERRIGQRVRDLELFEAFACVRLICNVLITLTSAGRGEEHPGTPALEARMRSGAPHTRGVVARLSELTGLRTPDLDDALTALFEAEPTEPPAPSAPSAPTEPPAPSAPTGPGTPTP